MKPAPLRREGTFLLRQRGSLLKLPGGERAIMFHADEKGHSERPMVLVPCQTLQRMEQVAADREQAIAYDVTGEVLAYRGVNYLLPTAYALVQPGAGEAGAEGAPAAPPAVPAKPPPQSSDPSVQDLIRQLEVQRERPRTIEPGIPAPAHPAPAGPISTAGEPAGGSAEAASRIIPEGKTVVRRRRRMVRGPGGEWSLAFDSGPQGETALDAPMLLVPCLILQRMEAWAASRGDAVSLEVSGQVLAYQGRNYLRPTLYRVEPAHELEPRQ